MDDRVSEVSFSSADGIHTVVGTLWRPVGEPRGVVQIAHGMVDHVNRYAGLAEALCARGFAVGGVSHLGHGKSAGETDDLGFFAARDGIDYVLTDMHRMTEYLKGEFPGLPVAVLGHSMGSFITRLYVERYAGDISACVIHGTGGPNPALPAGKALAALIRLFRGPRFRSEFLKNLTFAGYNSRFPKEEGAEAWLTRDAKAREAYRADPLCSFTFTVAAYQDLFRLVGKSNAAAWFRQYPKDLPTLVIAGDMDPVGAYGKGPTYVYNKLKAAGVTSVDLKLFPGARHELFNETCRDEVFAAIGDWMEGALL